MTQFWMDRKDDLKNLQYCIDNFECLSVFIRLAGSLGGTRKVLEKMEGRKLGFAGDYSDLKLLIDDKTVFDHKESDDSFKGWSVEYRNDFGMPVFEMSSPDETCHSLFQSTLRNMWGDHLVEISFRGKIPLIQDGEFYENWKRWRIE